MAKLLYLDYNCFQRAFDDQAQTRIRMEALACEEIFAMAEAQRVVLSWSFMHEDENALCPYLDRQAEVIKLSELCAVRIAPSEAIRQTALQLRRRCNLAAKDALHLACALQEGTKVFITCDDRVRKRTGGRIGNMVIVDPVEYVMMET